jgi:aminoglycoside phosphotransferase
MRELSGANLTEVSLEDAINVVSEALNRIHALPVEAVPSRIRIDLAHCGLFGPIAFSVRDGLLAAF